MYLHDNLQVCLLAFASRNPYHIVDTNEAVLGPQAFETQGRTVAEIIEQFEGFAPYLLQKRANMTIDECNCTIYLPEYSEEVPAFWLHCRGKLPPHHVDILTNAF